MALQKLAVRSLGQRCGLLPEVAVDGDHPDRVSIRVDRRPCVDLSSQVAEGLAGDRSYNGGHGNPSGVQRVITKVTVFFLRVMLISASQTSTSRTRKRCAPLAHTEVWTACPELTNRVGADLEVRRQVVGAYPRLRRREPLQEPLKLSLKPWQQDCRRGLREGVMSSELPMPGYGQRPPIIHSDFPEIERPVDLLKIRCELPRNSGHSKLLEQAPERRLVDVG